MSIVESKSLLAKLLAEENISVQHRKTQTAYFDVKQRILVCPILKDMPSELYDLLMGHEVGHALYTPSQGWHDALVTNETTGFKSYLNVVEDARIERKIKTKFPGLRSSFYKGYKNLFERDFFGIAHQNVNKLPLIDRINLHFKLGTLVSVTFSTEEMEYVDRINDAETWDEVVQIAKDLHGKAKKEKEEDSQLNDFDMLDNDDLQDILDSMQTESSQSDEEENDDDSLDTDPSDDDSSTPDSDGFKSGNYEDGFFDYEKNDPESLTDKNFRRRERELVDEKCIPIAYANLPKFKLDSIVIPHKIVHAAIKKAGSHASQWAKDKTVYEAYNVTTKEFFEKNTRYINYMVKEFELRKNAKQFARASVNKTGELDMKKISKHQLTEDIFRRMTVVPQGKNHGLLLYLDLSGSMIHNMQGTIEQLLILTTFCRKVNIPFDVYGFSDSLYSLNLVERKGYPYSKDEGDIILEKDFHLKHYFSSSMSRNEYNEAMLNMLFMGKLYAHRQHSIVETEHLNGTPLDEAIACSIDMALEFRKRHRLEVLTTMFLTDGESNRFYDTCYDSEGNSQSLRAKAGSGWEYNLVLSHKSIKTSVMKNNNSSFTRALLELNKKITQANLVGFFISGVRPYKSTVKSVYDDFSVTIPVNFETEMALARKNKFYPIKGAGFDVYFVVPPGNELIINDGQIDAPIGTNKNDLRKAFMKTLKSRAVNRVFLSRFCNTLSENM